MTDERDQSTIAILNGISEFFSRYCLIVLLLLGTIGLTLNTLIFTRKTFRQTTCVHYFLSSTIANYFVIYFILPSRILSDGFAIDPGTSVLFYCKLRFFTYFTAKSLSSWFVVLACFDRRMSSSRQARRRAFSRSSVSRWVIPITACAACIFYGHVLVFYQIDSNRKCSARSGLYRLFNDSLYLIGYSITPPLLMLILSFSTIQNARRTRRVGIQSIQRLSNLKRRDQALMLMVLFQVTFTILASLPHAVEKLYNTLTIYSYKSPLTKASDHLFTIIVRSISFTSHSCSFYILTISSPIFRVELMKLFRHVFFYIRRRFDF